MHHCLPARKTASDQNDIEDGTLLTWIAGGDMRAMATIYERHSRAMLGAAHAILRSRTDAEDIVQEVFVRLAERAMQYRPAIGTVRSWLLGAARNACIDRMRRRAYAARMQPALETFARAWGPDEAHLALMLDGRRALRAAATLPVSYRTTIEALYCGDLSCSELARRDAVPIGTVKSRAARALDRIRDLVEGGDLQEAA